MYTSSSFAASRWSVTSRASPDLLVARSDVKPALAKVDVAKAQTAELAAADAAHEQSHHDRAVAVPGLALASDREEPQKLVVGERAAWLVLDSRCADVLEDARAAVAQDPPLREECREAPYCLPGTVRGLGGDRRATVVEVRVHDAGLDVFDAGVVAELRRDPAVIEPELRRCTQGACGLRGPW